MASVMRSVLALVVALTAPGLALAEGTVPREDKVRWECTGHPSIGIGKQYGDSPEAACSAAFSGSYSGTDGAATITYTQAFKRCDPVSGLGSSEMFARCYWSETWVKNYANGNTGSGSSPDGWADAVGRTTPTCPDNSAPDSSGACTCSAGYTPSGDGQRCEAACTVKEVVSSGYFDIGTVAGATPVLWGCKGSCEVVFDGESPAGSSMVNGVKHWYAKGSYANTGRRCSASNEASKQVAAGVPTKPVDGCAPGQGSATMNGKTVCVDQSTDKPTAESEDKASTKTEKSTVTNPDGSTTTTETTTKTGADGSKEVTVTRTTTRPDGSVSVDTETTGRVNEPPSNTDDGSEEPERGECEKNPSTAGCGGDPAAVGTLYTPKDKTLGSVLAQHRDAFMSSPFGSAVGGFFVVNASASCPTWSAQIPYLEVDMSFDQLCSSYGTQALAALKVAILLVCSFFAFRIAVE